MRAFSGDCQPIWQAGEIHLLAVNLAVFRAKRGLPGVLFVRMILDEE